MKIRFDELASMIESLYYNDVRFDSADDVEGFIEVLECNSTETIITK